MGISISIHGSRTSETWTQAASSEIVAGLAMLESAGYGEQLRVMSLSGKSVFGAPSTTSKLEAIGVLAELISASKRIRVKQFRIWFNGSFILQSGKVGCRALDYMSNGKRCLVSCSDEYWTLQEIDRTGSPSSVVSSEPDRRTDDADIGTDDKGLVQVRGKKRRNRLSSWLTEVLDIVKEADSSLLTFVLS